MRSPTKHARSHKQVTYRRVFTVANVTTRYEALKIRWAPSLGAYGHTTLSAPVLV